jgi:hypothetical protein
MQYKLKILIKFGLIVLLSQKQPDFNLRDLGIPPGIWLNCLFLTELKSGVLCIESG